LFGEELHDTRTNKTVQWLKNREEDSNIYEQKYYFLGELDHYDEELLDYLEKIGVDKEYIATC